jgi:hypothetical protein
MLRNTALDYRRLILTALCILCFLCFFLYTLVCELIFACCLVCIVKCELFQLIFFFDVILRRDFLKRVLSCICYLVHCLVHVSLSCFGLDCVICIPGFDQKLRLLLLMTVYLIFFPLALQPPWALASSFSFMIIFTDGRTP